ncbi:RING finger and transmembrane domain-containing protein 2-like [Lineus longissimus]|uniref:RING finger and transmembrane domain-containing protein 2-like n=1 Tax=Lineus longissimus TaxID=88925 RepID=UPI002B4D7F2F
MPQNRSGGLPTEVVNVLNDWLPVGVDAEEAIGAVSMPSDGQSNTFVVNIDPNTEEPANGNRTGHGHAHSHSHGHGHSHDAQPPPQQTATIGRPDLMTLWKLTQGFAPFLLLIFAKLLYDHRLGVLILIGVCGTFYHSNTVLVKLVGNRDSYPYPTLKLLSIIFFLVLNVFAIYFVFADQQLYRSLYFSLPGIEKVDFWMLLWIVGITDFVIKFVAIGLKTVITIIPKACIATKRRGKYYMFIEYTAQFYRCLTPVTPWCYFLLDSSTGAEWFSYFLLGIYVFCKASTCRTKCNEFISAWRKFRVDVNYGSSPSSDDMKTSGGDACPICQDDYHDPVMLTCKHIFCEDCVSMWFDREPTCPMCRAAIAENPAWRDGSTAVGVQLF